MSAPGSDTNYGDLMKRALLKLQEAQAKLDAHERARHEGIAIVGIGCRFPGGAVDPAGYWRVLSEGMDTIAEVPSDRWNADSLYHPDPDQPGKVYTRSGGFLRDIDQFAPRFFGISPREASRMDPQHRLLLEVAWEAMERSGRSPSTLSGSRTGVFIGMMGQDYTQIATQSPEVIDAHTGAGNSASVAAGRLSFTFGFQGPSLTLDTACSSSLVAVHLAIRSLRQRESDYALAGGVNLLLSPVATLIESRTRMLSPDGRCKTFDASADGIGRGEGCGLIFLRRLSDAIKDGDPIIAVLRGSAVNQDGRTSGLTVPNGLAQQNVIRDALSDAQVEASQVGYVEAHGTGTSLGDPIELEALASIYGDRRTRKHPLMVGSVKTNLGHLEGAAGISGLIKSALCLANEEVVPHLHLRTPTPHVDWSQLFVEIPTARKSWGGADPRFAAVSSFGFSGTNAHVILESAPSPRAVSQEVERPLHVLALSARSGDSLRRLAGSLADELSGAKKDALADVCHTVNVGRSALEERAAFVAPTSEDMAALLRGFSKEEALSPGTSVRGRRDAEAPRIAFLFTGQGAQYVGMGRELFETQPGFRRDILRYEEILKPYLDRPLTEVLFQEDPTGALNETRYTQPALVALELALAGLMRSWGLRADAVLGHSIGEYSAAIFAGALEPETGLPLIAERARLMQALPERGVMLAVFADEARVVQALAGHPRVTLAAVNGPRSTVISGEEASIDAIAQALTASGIESRRLNVSHAFHSPLMQPMVAEFERVAGRVRFQRPRIDLISNLDGAEVGEDTLRPDYWSRHVVQPVRFAEGIQTLVRRGVRVFLEIGPKPVLSNIARDVVASEESLWLDTLHPRRSDWAGLLRSLAGLYTRGVGVDWERFDGDYGRRRLALPTYPFERQRYWLDTPAPWLLPTRRASAHPLLGARLDSAALREGTTVYSSEFTVAATPFLSDHRVYGRAVTPAAAYVEMVATAAVGVLGTEALSLEDVSFHQPLSLSEQQSRIVQTILENQGEAGLSCTVVSKGDERDDGSGTRTPWTTHMTCRVSALSAPPPTVEREAWQRGCSEPVSIEALSSAIREHGLDYGPSLQVMSSLHQGPGAALSLCHVEPGTRYRVHPALFDACLRTGAAILPLTPDDTLHLPVGIQKLDLYRSLPEGIWTHAVQRAVQGSDRGPITDMTLCAEDGTVVASLSGLSVLKAERDALRNGSDSDFLDWLYRLTWTAHTATHAPRLESQPWLLFAEEGAFGAKVAEALTKRGERFIRVRKGRDFSSGPEGIQLDPSSPEHFTRLMAQFESGPPGGLLYLWGLDERPDAELSLADLSEAQVSGCLGALHLTQAVERLSWAVKPRLVLVTQGTQHLPSDTQEPRVAQAPLWGFGQAVATELPHLRCLRVDLDAEPNPGAFLRALALPESETQVVLRGESLYTARLERARPRANPAKTVAISAEASYLVTGGLGGLGLRLADWLAERGARHLVLMGRSAPSPEAQTRLAALEARGVHVRVALADVASHEAVARVLSGGRDEPPMRGIFHSAGVLRDGTLDNQTAERFREVLAPKVQGAWNLHTLSAGLDLDFFVCFSSVASLLGNPGQSNYVAANAFLDALAHLRHVQGEPALSINWGSWAEVGMASRLSRADTSRPGARGFGSIPVEQGFRVLGRLLEGAPAQMGVCPIDWPRLTEQMPSLARQALVQDFVGAAPARTATSAFRQHWDAAPMNRRRELLAQHVEEQVATTLGLSKSERIGAEERLFELGIDSLLAVEIKNRLSSSLGKSLRTTLLFDFPTLNGLVEHLAGELGFVSDAPKPDESERQERDALTAGIQKLSEQELTSLIDQELESVLSR